MIVTPNEQPARPTRTLHSVGRRHDHPALTDPAEVHVRIERDGLEVVDLDPGDLCGRRQQVIHERARKELHVLVVRGPLEQNGADALRNSAAHLPFDDRGIDERTAVFDDDVPLDRDVARLDVDVDDRAVRASRPSAFAAVERLGCLGEAARAHNATSARLIALAGRPVPRPAAMGSRSSTLASRMAADTSRMRARSARAVWRATPPAIVAARLPPVPKPGGEVGVADDDIHVFERTPISWAAIWANVVSWLWP